MEKSNPSPSKDSNDKRWLNLQFHDDNKTSIIRPHELEGQIQHPPKPVHKEEIFDRIAASMLGMAIGDALGAHVEFRPHDYLVEHPVTDLSAGGTWGRAGTGPANRYRSGRTGTGPDRTDSENQPGR